MCSTLVSRIGYTDAGGGALADLSGSEGLAVQNSTVLPLGVILWDGTAAATPATLPVGVIQRADNFAGGEVSVVCHGFVDAIVGAAGIAGGTTMVTADAAGEIVAFAFPGAGDNAHCLGFLAAELGTAAVAAGSKVRIFVQPQVIQG
jgi:hypothetical protein